MRRLRSGTITILSNAAPAQHVFVFQFRSQLIQASGIDPGTQTAEMRLHHERRLTRSGTPQPAPQRIVNDSFERAIRGARKFGQSRSYVVVQCQRGPHINIMMPPEIDVKMLAEYLGEAVRLRAGQFFKGRSKRWINKGVTNELIR